MNKCKVCKRELPLKPIIEFENMPSVAQYFPDASSLKKDRGVSLNVFQCEGCGLLQLTSKAVPYYKEVIRAAAISDEMINFRKRQFGDFIEKYALKGKKIIEIGCGRGEYLQVMNQFPVDAYGLESSAKSVKACANAGLNAIQGFVNQERYSLPTAPFDAFYMLSFFEHLPHPNSVLRGISQILTAEGVGLIEVPNFDMMLQKNLFSEFTADHLSYFSRDTLTTVLKLNGFEVAEIGTVWHDYILSAVVRKRKQLELSAFLQNKARITCEIKNFVSRFGDNKVAVWGAGHQALAVLALVNLSGRIKYVIDSAKFKQMKFTPATHIPIVAPERLQSDPMDAVIIMAAGYSDEVAKILRNLAPNVCCAILRENELEEVTFDGGCSNV